MRRPYMRETPVEKLFRYRGVILVVSIPVCLILLVVGLMPRAHHDDIHHQFHHAQHGSSPAATSPYRYAVVMDAGSTGSRVHIFRFKDGTGGLELVDDTFEKLEPGLSSFADAPEDGAASLVPLLEKAVASVPPEQQSKTSIELRATAGLRLLPGSKAENLLQQVVALLGQYKFKFNADSVTIMDGADEGAFQWVTTNYLLGRMGGPPSKTVGAIDLGGGSVQLAYALPQNKAASAPKGYVRTLHGGGASYHVYVHSYLGYGIMAARAASLSASAEGNACIPSDFNSTYPYAGKTHRVSSAPDGQDFDKCLETQSGVLNKGKACREGEAAECAFNGVWGGGGGDGLAEVYASSYLYDRAEQSALVRAGVNSAALPGPGYLQAARAACSSAAVQADYPLVPAAHAPFFCMDLAYAHALLSEGFGIGSSTKVTLVKKIEYQGNAIEAAWPLGAAINSLA